MQRVLHISESFGGGVATAVAEYVKSTPEFEHHLLHGQRVEVTSDSWGGFASRHQLSPGFGALGEIRSVCREIAPDIVHVHSSWAGLSARLALSRRRTPIVYTPHCFAFERKDVSRSHAFAYWGVERLLSFNTTAYAGCSQHEAHVASRWVGPGRAVHVPNIARVPQTFPATPRSRRVVAVGRLSTQKDPSWFADVVRALPGGTEVVWVGDGEPAFRGELESLGVRVTGWVPRAKVLELLGTSKVHVMTSLWEGFPMAILEAFSSGVPSVVRRIPTIPEAPVEESFDDPRRLAARTLEILDDEQAETENMARWGELLSFNTPENQRRELLRVYGRCLQSVNRKENDQ